MRVFDNQGPFLEDPKFLEYFAVYIGTSYSYIHTCMHNAISMAAMTISDCVRLIVLSNMTPPHLFFSLPQ